MNWNYKEKEYTFSEPLDPKQFGFVGFVYLIENISNGKKYIGKKGFFSTKTLPITKKRKRRKRVISESDWKSYYGSSDSLKADIELYGPDNFRRTILHLCRTKGECSYMEAREQFDRNVLLDESYYNNWISVKITATHMKKSLHAEDYNV